MIDQVSIYTSDFTPVLPGVTSMRAAIAPTAAVMDHPVESGAVIADHKIVKPTEISLTIFLGENDYAGAYQNLRNLFVSGDLVTVQTKAAVYANMLVYEIPHEETPERMDTVIVEVKLREVVVIEAQSQALPPRKVKRGADSSTRDRGEQQGRRSSKLFNAFGGAL